MCRFSGNRHSFWIVKCVSLLHWSPWWEIKIWEWVQRSLEAGPEHKNAYRTWSFPPKYYYSVSAFGQCESGQLSFNLVASVATLEGETHVSRLRPGRWPKLLAPIRSGNPPCKSRRFGQSAALALEGQLEAKERRNGSDQRKKAGGANG